MAASPPEAPARKLRWFQYSVRSLLLFMLLVSLGMSWVAVKIDRARRQERAVEEIEKLGGYVMYDYVFQGGVPPGPAWLRSLWGENILATVVVVNFDCSRVSEAGLEHLKGLTKLEGLVLNNTEASDAWLKHLEGLTRLQGLWLHHTRVTDAGLEHLKRLTQLQSLDLWDTRVTDGGLEQLKGLTQLQGLDLTDTQVTDEGVKRLQKVLPKCKIER